MNQIELFLGKFNKLLSSEAALKTTIREVLQTELHVDAKDLEIVCKNGTISVSGKPAFKALLFRKKLQILQEMKKRLGDKVVFDIR